MNPTQIRSAVLLVLSLLSGTGLLPTDVKEYLTTNADTVVSLLLFVWSTVAFARSRKEKGGESE